MSSLKDVINTVQETSLLVPVLTAPGVEVLSAAFDHAADQGAMLNCFLGVPLDTLAGSKLWTLYLMECDTSSGTYTAVPDADLINANGVAAANGVVVDSNAEASRIYSFGYQGVKQFLKLKATPTGTHTNGTPMAMWATSNPSTLPAANRVSPA